MIKDQAMSIYRDAIFSGDSKKFFDELNGRTDGYPMLTPDVEELLITRGTDEMLQGYLANRMLWTENEDLLREKRPEFYRQYHERYHHVFNKFQSQ